MAKATGRIDPLVPLRFLVAKNSSVLAELRIKSPISGYLSSTQTDYPILLPGHAFTAPMEWHDSITPISSNY
jgi:hypothetical protein